MDGSQVIEVAEIESISRIVAGLPAGEHDIEIPVGTGAAVQMRLHKMRRARALVVSFHGSIDRRQRQLPVYARVPPRLERRAHWLSIADPSLRRHPDLQIAWYAGDADCDTQGLLPGAIRGIARGVRAGRTVYTGSSGGGFAALFFSRRHPDSCAVVSNPQTDIEAFREDRRTEYRAACWPAAAPETPLDRLVCARLPAVYARGFRNTVVLIQSIADDHHYQRHMLPFAAAASRAPDSTRFLLNTDYWGELGHVAAPHVHMDWLLAACVAPSLATPDLLSTLHAVRSARVARTAEAGQPRSGEGRAFSASDLATAARLRALRAAQAAALSPPDATGREAVR